MNAPENDHQRIEELLLVSVNQSLPEAERAELNERLRSNAEARHFASRHLAVDALLTDFLASSEAARRHSPLSSPIKTDFHRPSRLARAAAWIGVFHLFGNTAEAATTTAKGTTILTQSTFALLMKIAALK